MDHNIISRFLHAVTLIWTVPVTLLCALLTLYLLAASTYYTLYDEIDFQLYAYDTFPLIIALTAIVFAGFYFLYSLLKKNRDKLCLPSSGKRKLSIPLAILLVLLSVISLFLIFSVRGLATNDAKIIDGIVNSFLDGDYGELTSKASYLYVYPFQLGYVAFCEMMGTLFGKSNFIAYQLVNVLSVAITLIMLYMIAKELFEDVLAVEFTAVYGITLLFLFIHTTLIYSDIPSLAPQAASLYLMCRYIKRHRALYGILSAVFLGISCVLKTNSYIALVATVIILLMLTLKSLTDKGDGRTFLFRHLAIIAVFVICCFGAPKTVDIVYAGKAGIEAVPEGVPSSAYFAMGIQYNPYGQSGWYNGYNVNTYRDNGFDRDLTDAVAKESFSERLSELLKSPAALLYFYGKKFLTQWADSSFISLRELELTGRHVEGQPGIVGFIIYGSGRTLLYYVMHAFQILTYAGVAVYGFYSVRKKDIPFAGAFILLYVFGGMLFHELWEGSSRYTMRYYIFLLPFAARGMMLMLDAIGGLAGHLGKQYERPRRQ